jgi:cell wall-associated NlpC family hydrolase
MTLRLDSPVGQIATYVEGLETEIAKAVEREALLKAQIAEMKDREIPVPTPQWQVKADTIIAIAKALDALKIPYVFGGESIDGMDCSGFTQFLFKQVGYNLPRVSDNQSDVGTAVKYEDLRAGDLIFYDFNNDGRITHVSICMGGGKMIHTNTPANGINIQSTSWNQSSIAKIRRIL